MPVLISPAEREYIINGVDHNIRADGRGRLDYRQIVVETGLISQASGSARCRLGEGTDVLVGVKVEVGQVDMEGDDEVIRERKSKRGRVICNVECSPIASQQFAGRGADDFNNELTQTLDRVLNGPQGGLNLEKLCIIPGAQCWVVNIDALILDYAGNLLDMVFITTRAALHNTKVPKTIITETEDGLEFDFSDDMEDAERIEGWENVPTAVTLSKIGSRHVVDATPLEELTIDARLLVTVNKDGKICGVQKGGSGSIEPSLLNEMIQTGGTIGQHVIQKLDEQLEREEKEASKKTGSVGKLGFFAAI
ncbi:1528_t:CDS:2 [Paraglomus occultum]|uniref:Ribosomal RNA-processing protein 42 n=1 Tax=Paraglomus occultum TaxID=144539 RepID=A0A9N8ZFK4_9GLOM|nr:1528_t:CDS:2 [Paraglomus occultum]